MKTKHTPGPWAVTGGMDGRQGRLIEAYATDGNPLRHLVASTWFVDIGPNAGERRDANAALVAAAPDLLAALIRLVDERCPFEADTESCECGEDGAGNGGTCEHIQARRAIAKAMSYGD